MPNDNYPSSDEFAQPHADNLFDAMVAQVIQQNAAWLQSAPRTTREIAAHLLPMEISPEGPDTDLLLLIASCMWDQGYTAGARDPEGSEWQWLEVGEV
jgi:hypothetical protein